MGRVLVGPWNQVRALLRRMPYDTVRDAQRGLGRAAMAYRDYWRWWVEMGALPIYRKAPVTRASMGGKDTPLVWRKEYVKSIRKYPRGLSSSAYFVGIKEDRPHKADGRSILQIAITHEYGRLIRPKNARALAVPVTAKARRYGSPRNYPWRDGNRVFIPHKAGARSIGGFYEQVGRGKKRKRYRLVYLLMPWVKLPPRPAMTISWRSFRGKVPWIVHNYIGLSLRKRVSQHITDTMWLKRYGGSLGEFISGFW